MSQAPLLPSEHFSPSVSLHSGRPATTSLEVAKFFSKRHDHVVRSIQDLISNTPKSFSAPNFGAAEYSDEQGKPRPMFILYRDGFMLLVMGYTGKKALAMKLAYIEAFNRMEEELARQKEAARNITQDIVDFPGSISITPSSVADRKPLRALVGSWAKLSNAPFDACWNQLKAAFNLANIKELPQEWIPDALAWVQAKIDALPKALPPQPERLPLYRNGCFYPPHRDRSHVPGPQEAALLELWQDWTRREASLRQEFMAMLRELDARRGDLFSYAVSDLGRNADTMFSPQCLLDSLFQSRTEAEQRFRQALEDASLHLRLSLNVAVALGR
ncbi:MAG: Rha family transcriptional regulator [Desulfovibrio piger]|uniref:Rha family transcriptional regulator n=1 Tax=Desulfovibrio piger TaxID=901 RepID=UPI002A7F381B|nr:Rha family transcriptional regulator [Desulfovibrio piger]MDY3880759.1 Rha family transcriptional regulator [Desulfovibrio piger]